jgi:hypothetical protein
VSISASNTPRVEVAALAGVAHVAITYRDREQNETRKMTINTDEFIRRFLLHVLPKGFMKTRYFGFLANKNKKKAIPILRKLIDPEAKLPEKNQRNNPENDAPIDRYGRHLLPEM